MNFVNHRKMLRKIVLAFLFLSCASALKLSHHHSRNKRSVNEEISKSNRLSSTYLPYVKSNFLESNDSVQILSDYLDSLSKYGNVTLVGWQNIEDENDPALVRTIELSLLHDDTPVLETDMAKDREDDSLSDMIEAIQQHYQNLQSEQNEVKLALTIEEYYRDGIFDAKFYLNDGDIYYSEDTNVNILMRKNITVDTYEEGKELVKNIHGTYKQVHVAVMNENKELLAGEGHLVPELVANVADQEDANIQTTEMALKFSVVGYYLNSTDTLNYVRDYMKEQYPKYTWHVVNGSPYHYLTKDVSINIEFPYEDYSLTIFGKKK